MKGKGEGEEKESEGVCLESLAKPSYSSSVIDSYKTLRIQRGASESEVRKAFRQVFLQVSIP